MSFIPACELGLWNAWILVIPMLIIFFYTMRVTSIGESGEAEDFELTKKEKRVINAVFLPMVISFIYAIFLPLQMDTAWLYIGLVTYLFGMVFIIIAVRNFASSPKDKVITKGLYSVTRNPEYIGLLLMFTGLGIACISWLSLLLTGILLILLNLNMPAEERYCFYKYGDEYQKYRNITPRWIGIPKSNGT